MFESNHLDNLRIIEGIPGAHAPKSSQGAVNQLIRVFMLNAT